MCSCFQNKNPGIKEIEAILVVWFCIFWKKIMTSWVHMCKKLLQWSDTRHLDWTGDDQKGLSHLINHLVTCASAVIRYRDATAAEQRESHEPTACGLFSNLPNLHLPDSRICSLTSSPTERTAAFSSFSLIQSGRCRYYAWEIQHEFLFVFHTKWAFSEVCHS